MLKRATALVLVAALGLSACDSVPDSTKATLTGGTAGAIGGAVLMQLIGANPYWTAAGAVAGAAAGALVARNSQTNQCYYSNGDGTYSPRTCS